MNEPPEEARNFARELVQAVFESNRCERCQQEVTLTIEARVRVAGARIPVVQRLCLVCALRGDTLVE